MNDTRQAILRVAMAHFSAMEYPMVNLEAIADEAHVTRAPLYYYFRNKEGLYRAVVEASLEEARGRLDALLSAEENVFEIIHKEYAYCVRDIGQYRRLWNPGPGAPDCGAQVLQFKQWLVDRKLEIFTAAQRRGELSPECDVSELVTLIYVFYDGVLDTLQSSQQLSGFNRELLTNSDAWFMRIVRSRFGG